MVFIGVGFCFVGLGVYFGGFVLCLFDLGVCFGVKFRR